jgi:site-specific DNA recombinase
MGLSMVEVPGFWRGGVFAVMAAGFAGLAVGRRLGGDGLLAWAERTGHRPAADQRRGGLRFAFYGRVSTEDYQDPVTSRARQVGQAEALVAGHGRIVAHF